MTTHTRGTYARAVLAGLGMKPTASNRKATKGRVTGLLAWMYAESGPGLCNGTSGARYNPLNSTQGSAYPKFNSVGVRNYPTFEVGVGQTVATLTNGLYEPILAALRAADPYALGPAIAKTPWGTGGLVSQVVPGITGTRRLTEWLRSVG